jgi:hypothetical protein
MITAHLFPWAIHVCPDVVAIWAPTADPSGGDYKNQALIRDPKWQPPCSLSSLEVQMKSTSSNRLIGVVIFLVATTVAFSQTDSQQGPPQSPFGGQPPNLSDVAKNVVVGQLKNVEKTKLTIAKPDGVEQAIAVDANTKFVGDHGDAISLADFKTGDHIAATGALKEGVFVAAQLAKIPAGPGAPPPPPPFPNRGSN